MSQRLEVTMCGNASRVNGEGSISPKVHYLERFSSSRTSHTWLLFFVFCSMTLFVIIATLVNNIFCLDLDMDPAMGLQYRLSPTFYSTFLDFFQDCRFYISFCYLFVYNRFVYWLRNKIMKAKCPHPPPPKKNFLKK